MDNIRLVEHCKSGDRDALGLLYETYLPAMRDIVSYYINNSDVVWDVIHDGFIIAFTSIGTLNNGAKVEAWLTTIMKNLSLQYLKSESFLVNKPIPDIAVDANIDETVYDRQNLTFEELNALIDKLPDGYGKVFRLAVLEGLSHKEIGALLGIASHSSSSQLTRAKAMLRRLIVKYRIETGILSIISIILLLWNLMFWNKEENQSTRITSKKPEDKNTTVSDSINSATDSDSIIPKQTIINKTGIPLKQKLTADVTISNDSISNVGNDSVGNDSVVNDSIKILPYIISNKELITHEDIPVIQTHETSDWSMSLAYSGNLGHEETNRYSIPNPGLPNVESPSEAIEITEKSRHHIPVVIGLLVNKSFTSRWSIETGIRYSFLRSDFLSESKLMKKETIQRIHYIGVPLKINYRIFTYRGFSLYGQGGGALDIPVYGEQSVKESAPEWTIPHTATYRISAPLQWSVEGGLGLQYHFTPSFSIYAEPSFRYYFNPGSDIITIRQDKPYEFTIPIGLRLTW